MALISRLASQQGRRDEEPNKELGRTLAEAQDVAGIQEIAAHLRRADARIQADCLAVLEQVGLLAPDLIADYVTDFVNLLSSKPKRLVWAAMIDLALVADKRPREIFERRDDIVATIASGSVITKDNGIKTLARVAATGDEYRDTIWPFLLEQLENCRAKSVPQYAESISVAVTPETREQFVSVLGARMAALSSAQQRRLKKVLRAVGEMI
jgi:hypothetical protein